MGLELFQELEHREELLFRMVSGIRLDLDKALTEIRNLDETLMTILRVEEKESEGPVSNTDGR